MERTIITCSKTVLHNVLKCVEKANLNISDICLQPLAAGSIALSKDERNLGVALIDIGGGCTTVSVFQNEHLEATAIVALGGNNITKDTSISLRTTTEEAENIKLQYGHAFYDTALENETFDVIIIGSDQKETYNQLQISDIIEARLEEIFQLSAKERMRLGYHDLHGGFIFTGGTMKLPVILDL